MTVICLATAYLLGSLPWGLWIGRLRGVDVRLHGSGNLGATNVARVLGKKVGLLVLGLDALKGALAVLLARSIQADAANLAFLPAASGTVAVLGHVTTPWAGFRGGKGVATAAGVAALLAPVPFLVAMGVFGVTLAIRRTVSLGSILAAAVLPVAVHLTSRSNPERPWLLAWSLAAAVLVIARHSGNIRRLLAGTEPRLGGKTSITGEGEGKR